MSSFPFCTRRSVPISSWKSGLYGAIIFATYSYDELSRPVNTPTKPSSIK